MFTESDLSCNICHNLFEDPRVLPCGHSFCQKCIDGSLQQSAKCPTCQRLIELSKNAPLAALADQFLRGSPAGFPAQPKLRWCSETGPDIDVNELKLDNYVTWVAVCSHTCHFRSKRSGRVVPASSAGWFSAPLPQPCIVAVVYGKDHLEVLSVDGKVRLRCHCADLSLNYSLGEPAGPHYIWGLHCEYHLLFVVQTIAVTIMDLSGRTIRQVLSDTTGFGDFAGICGTSDSLFVSSGKNTIASLCNVTGLMQSVTELSRLPKAKLSSMVVVRLTTQQPEQVPVPEGIHILAADREQGLLHVVNCRNQRVVITHPAWRAKMPRFEGPAGMAFHSNSCLVFVSEREGHSVRALDITDGSLLWTLGKPGESGSGFDRLNKPWGLAMVTGGEREHLVVADCENQRLLVVSLRDDA